MLWLIFFICSVKQVGAKVAATVTERYGLYYLLLFTNSVHRYNIIIYKMYKSAVQSQEINFYYDFVSPLFYCIIEDVRYFYCLFFDILLHFALAGRHILELGGNNAIIGEK